MNFKKISHFITSDIWNFSLHHISNRKKIAIGHLRIFSLAFRGFKEDNCPLQASALTFYSLLSIVPVFAMLFSIAKGFGFEKLLEKRLLESFPTQQEIIHQFVNFAQSYLQNTSGGAIAFIGIMILLFTVIRVLSYIEKSFNSIWGIHKNRTLVRKFSDYLSIFLVSPVLIILSSSITVFISSYIADITESNAFLNLLSPLLTTLLKIFPYLLVWILFMIVYIVMPNTNVKFKSALYGAIIAGTLFQLVQWGFITFQFGVTKYNAIYGSFSILPLFLIWLQVSWTIVLLGAEIAFATQNSERYEFEKETRNISYYSYKFVSLCIMRFILQRFVKEESLPSAEDISFDLKIPIRLVNKIIKNLLQAKLINVVIVNEDDSKVYQPALESQKYTVANVIQKLEHTGVDLASVLEWETSKSIRKHIEAFEKITFQSTENQNLLAI